MRFFFDNNISHALNCLVQPQHEVVHLRDRFAPATSDADWMTKLANEMDWVIISADTAISRNPHEVEAWKQAGHPISSQTLVASPNVLATSFAAMSCVSGRT